MFLSRKHSDEVHEQTIKVIKGGTTAIGIFYQVIYLPKWEVARGFINLGENKYVYEHEKKTPKHNECILENFLTKTFKSRRKSLRIWTSL